MICVVCNHCLYGDVICYQCLGHLNLQRVGNWIQPLLTWCSHFYTFII